MYPDYLIHFNQNHDKKTGQFAPGDGDGDGIRDDHAHRNKKYASNASYKTPYGGKTRDEYMSEAANYYTKSGLKTGLGGAAKVKILSRHAANMDKSSTKLYNLDLAKNKKIAEKVDEAWIQGNIKAYNKLSKKLIKSYAQVLYDEELIKRSYDFGVAFAKEAAAALWGGTLGVSINALNNQTPDELYKEAQYEVNRKMSELE